MHLKKLFTNIDYIVIICLALVLSVKTFYEGAQVAKINESILTAIMNHDNLPPLIRHLFCVYIIILGCKIMINLMIPTLQKKFIINLQDSMISKVRLSDMLSDKNNGKHFSQIEQNAQKLGNDSVSYIETFISTLSAIVFSGYYILYKNPILFLFIIVIAFISIIIMAHNTSQKLAQLSKYYSEKNNEICAFQWEFIKNREISSFLTNDKLFEDYYESNQEAYELLLKMDRLRLVSGLSRRFGSSIILIFTCFLGGILFYFDKITIPSLFAIIILLPGFCGALFNIPKLLTDLSALKGLYQTVDNFFDLIQYDSSKHNNTLQTISTIKCQNLSFSYGNTQVLDNVNIEFKRGNMYAITGESGSGKSTLLKLIAQSCAINTGNIFFNRNSIKAIHRNTLWNKLGFMNQNPMVLSAELFKNIISGCEYNQEKVLRCLNDVNFESNIALNQIIDENSLSAGEKQKIALARLIYCDYDVLLLDEPTSTLDPYSQLYIAEKLNELKKSKIIILVTHSPDLANLADEIYNINNSKLRRIK